MSKDLPHAGQLGGLGRALPLSRAPALLLSVFRLGLKVAQAVFELGILLTQPPTPQKLG